MVALTARRATEIADTVGADIDRELRRIRSDALAAEHAAEERIRVLPPSARPSAANLLHYLALRRHDVRALQEQLACSGLSSLGRSEAHVLATLETVLTANGGTVEPATTSAPGFDEGDALLRAQTERLLGEAPASGRPHIMVTLPSEAADGPELIESLLASGMDCVRINTAHDGPESWKAMVEHVVRGTGRTGRRCRVFVDLAGPKLRTGALEDGPRVLRLGPARDAFGRVTAPARVRLLARGGRAAGPDLPDGSPSVTVEDAAWLDGLGPGTRIVLRDARGARRELEVAECRPGWVVATTPETTYLTEGTSLVREPDGESTTAIVEPLAHHLVLRPGSTLVLTRDQSPGRQEAHHARIPCTLPEAFEHVAEGQPVWFDDGKIGGTVTGRSPDGIRVRIDVARPGGSRLRAEKGINLPETDLRVPALSDADRANIPLVTRLADAVCLSFASSPDDVRALRASLDENGGPEVGIVLKIETRLGFSRLPELLLALMESPAPRGVMIARGDLAVECGWERLAEVQEEILWLAEASHTPVIWATQVLESMARTGRPSRAEITDAAMGARAECVMLNKGPRIGDAVTSLADILERMSEHLDKKTTLLRRLRAWD